MLVTQKFCWSHLGKTGGNSTKTMFDVLQLKDIILEHDIKNPEKHNTFSDYADICCDKKKILNIRRLPTWLISDWNHQLINPNNIRITEVSQEFKDSIVRGYFAPKGLKYHTLLADSALKKYFCAELGGIDFWIRTEFMGEDFISIIKQFVEVSEEQTEKILQVHINKTQDKIKKRNITSFSLEMFSSDELKSIYNSNPFWSSIEKKAYGNLLSEVE